MARSSIVLDRADIDRACSRMAHEIIERLHGADSVSILGIRSGGVWLGQLLVERLVAFGGVAIGFAEVNISSFRDDRPRTAVVEVDPSGTAVPELHETVVLVDDVIQSGRTARAALEAILSSHRPRLIQLAVLVDRGHREVPICPDYVGKNLPSALSEYVAVSPDGVTIHRP